MWYNITNMKRTAAREHKWHRKRLSSEELRCFSAIVTPYSGSWCVRFRFRLPIGGAKALS